MKILFVCKFNRFRSKVAEGLFNKLNKNKSNTASSAGVFEGIPVSKKLLKITDELKIKLSKNPQGLKETDLEKYDQIIIVANNVPKNLFQDKMKKPNVLHWKIKDTSENNPEMIKQIIKEIEKNINNLLKELK